MNQPVYIDHCATCGTERRMDRVSGTKPWFCSPACTRAEIPQTEPTDWRRWPNQIICYCTGDCTNPGYSGPCTPKPQYRGFL